MQLKKKKKKIQLHNLTHEKINAHIVCDYAFINVCSERKRSKILFWCLFFFKYRSPLFIEISVNWEASILERVTDNTTGPNDDVLVMLTVVYRLKITVECGTVLFLNQGILSFILNNTNEV